MIKVTNLGKRFGSFDAVEELNLQIHKGEIFGFLGANGAGKTTTIRMLCGLLKPSSGHATVNNYDISTNSEQVKQSLGYMSQRFSLYNDLKVAENIEFYAGIYRCNLDDSLRQIRPLMELFGLDKRMQDYASALPMGYKQRLSLICALVHDPPLVFLDEPTSGVDPQARREFWQVINTLAQQGKTVIVSTHFMDEAEYCHRVIIMQEGREVALGKPQKLKDEYGAGNMQELFLKLVGGGNA